MGSRAAFCLSADIAEQSVSIMVLSSAKTFFFDKKGYNAHSLFRQGVTQLMTITNL
jgi:hypothetical protein